MKIDSLFENVTPSSTPVGNQSQQAPKFGRDPKVLEDDKIEETTAGATGSGAVASVSQPMGTIQKRKGTGALLRGISTSEKYPNSKAVKEDEIVEQDIIINPSLLTGPKPGFHNRMDMEGDTVKNSLHTIIRVADDLNDRIENHTQFPEWVSEKIGAIKSMMVNVMDYVISQQERGDDHVIDEFAVGEEIYENAQVLKLNDYNQWLDKVDAQGAEKHMQKNRTLIVAQSWDGNKVGEFDLKSNQGWVMSQGVAEGSLNEFVPNDGGDNGDGKIYYAVQDHDKHYSTYALNRGTIDTDEFKARFGKKLWVKGPFMDLSDAQEAIWAHIEKNKGMAEGIYVPEIPRAPQPKPDPKNKTVDEDWQKVNRKDKTSGMSKKAVKAYRRENPGSKLQTAVTTKPSKLKKGSKSAKRRKSFCARMKGMKKAHAGAKTKRNPDSPINKALRRWNCESIEEMQHMIMVAEHQINELKDTKQIEENLHKWFKEKWVRFGPDGKIRGDCARGDDSEGKPKCLPQSKAHSLGKKGRASAAARKRREDPNPERSGKAINVATKKKTEESESKKIKHNKSEIVNYIEQKGYGKLLNSMSIKEILKLIHDEHQDWENDKDLPNSLREAWSEKYKRSINCNNPKGFSQRAHCQGRKKNEDIIAEVMSNKGADEVRRIQQMLNSKFDANLDVDGILGPLTIKSIKKFLPSSPAKKAPMPNKTPAVTGKKVKHDVSEEQLDEKCWTGYHKEGNKKMFGKTYPNCVKNTNEEQLDEKCWDTHKQVGMKKKGGKMVPNCVPKESVNEEQDLCPHCGGVMYEMSMMNEKKDACYYKVKSRYKVWPSAYASGALVKCRKKGAKNWGNKSESVEEGFDELDKYMKAKSALKPKGGSGIKSGTYGSPEHRKRGRPQGPRGGEGSGFPQKTSFSTVPHDYSARRKFKNDFDDDFYTEEEQQTQQEKPAQEKETPNYLNTIKNIGTAALALKDKDLAELLKQELHQMLLNKTSGEPNR